MMNDRQLFQRAKELSPWHFDFEISPGVKTTSFNDLEHPDWDLRHVKTIDPSEIVPLLKEYYPSGLAGKDVLDVGCNAGGYCFVAHELGARSVTGIDVRRHWIDQAEWIKSVKYPDTDDAIKFEEADIRHFLRRGENRFDIILFKGVFYHLADPIGTLLDLCDATKELLLVDTASCDSIPEYCITPITESTTHVMSGVDGLAWLPGGPEALRPTLELKGFKSIQRVFWLHGVTAAGWGRFRIAASRLSHIQGFVDFFRPPNVLAGWVRQENHEGPIDVNVLQDDVVIGSTQTGEERSSGNFGFVANLSRPITLAEILSGTVKVCCVDTDGKTREIQIWPKLSGEPKQ